MYCLSCGAENSDSAKFCKKCGHKLEHNDTPVGFEAVADFSEPETKEPEEEKQDASTAIPPVEPPVQPTPVAYQPPYSQYPQQQSYPYQSPYQQPYPPQYQQPYPSAQQPVGVAAPPQKKGKKKAVIWTIVIVLLLALIAGAVIFFVTRPVTPKTSASAVLTTLKNADLPIVYEIIYTEDNDPNGAGNNGYLEKANFADEIMGAGYSKEEPQSGSIEIFRSELEAKERAEYLKLFSSLNLYGYQIVKGEVLLRLNSEMPREHVQMYADALGVDIFSEPEALDSSDPTGDDSNQELPPLYVEDLPLSITIEEPDIIGMVYMSATYTNQSTQTIDSLSMTVLLKDSNEKTYLSCYDTVLPGETSPIFTTFGPKSLSTEDIEILEYSISIIDETGETIYIDYDCKLGRYTWY